MSTGTKAGKRDAETESVEHHDGGEEGARMVQSELEPPDRQMEKAQLVSHLRGALEDWIPSAENLFISGIMMNYPSARSLPS